LTRERNFGEACTLKNEMSALIEEMRTELKLAAEDGDIHYSTEVWAQQELWNVVEPEFDSHR